MDNAKIEYLKANGVNTEIGIQNTSDVETYNEILLDFCNSFPQEMQKVNAYRQNNDINNYTILVHALKSNCRMLGFTSLGEMFYQHELAGKENNTTYINNNFDSLISECNKVYELLLNYKNRG